MTVQELIEAAMRAIGAVAAGETPSSDELTDGMEALNIMLNGWAADGLTVNAITQENFTLTSGTNEYTIGSGGDFNTTRPSRILRAWTRTGTSDYLIKLITAGQYAEISLKSTAGRPSQLYYNPLYALGKIYLYYTPGDAYTLYLESLTPFTVYSSLATTVSLPPEYNAVIKWNLAEELAPEFGITPSAKVVRMADSSMTRTKAKNASSRAGPVKLGIPAGRRGASFDITEG